MSKLVQTIFKNVDLTEKSTFQTNEINSLPAPVQNYLELTGIIGKEKIKTVRLKQKGLFNINGKKWTSMNAEQYFSVESKEFIWKARSGIISVVDQFVQGIGNLKVKLFGVIKLGESKGIEIDQGEILRFLTEIIWFPSAFTADYICWDAIDDNTSKATISCGKNSASANFHFTSSGEIEKITAKRYREVKGDFELNDWEISNLEYKEYHGITLPYKAHVTWKLESGDLCYYKFEITGIAYNDLSMY